MRFAIPIVVFVALCLGAAQAHAASCSSFAVIKSYNAEESTVEIDFQKGKERDYFPRPEGASEERSGIPGRCRGKVTKQSQFVVKPTGGKMTVTQVRSNFESKMLNDTDDKTWLPAQLEKLIADQTKVVIVIRPGMGKDAPLGVTTIYMPITDEELAEIKRIEDEAEDI